MRRLLPALVLALALAGCGDKGPSGAGGPLDEALGYLPKDAPVAVAIETDPDGGQWKNVNRLLGKFPLIGGQVKQGVVDQLKQSGVDFEKDIKPLLGNEAVIGVPRLEGGEAKHYVAAIEAKDGGKLDKLFDRPEVREIGEKDGYTLYEDREDGDFAARNGDVVVFADTRDVLEQAIDTRGGDDRLREEDFEKGLGDLPDDALVRVYADMRAALAASPEAASARRVPWVAALRTLGLTVAAKDDGVEVEVALKTEASELTPEDLPLAAGDEAPPVAGEPSHFQIGLRNPAQVAAFVKSTAEVVDPAKYQELESKLGAMGLDLEQDLIRQFTGNAQVAVAPDGKFALRADLADPDAFERTLQQAPPDDELVWRVVDGRFVVANDEAMAASIERAEERQVEGRKGALVFSADTRRLVGAVLARQGEAAQLGGSLFTGALRDFTGSVWADTSGVRGSFKLGIE